MFKYRFFGFFVTRSSSVTKNELLTFHGLLMVSTCSMVLHPHTMMLSFSKSAPAYDGHSKNISFTLSHHDALAHFVQRFILFIWKYHSTLKARTRPDKMFCDWSPRGSFIVGPQPTFFRSLSTLLEVSHPIWNSSSKPKTSQDGVFNNRRTLRTTNETTPARGGSDGTQRV